MEHGSTKWSCGQSVTDLLMHSFDKLLAGAVLICALPICEGPTCETSNFQRPTCLERISKKRRCKVRISEAPS